MALPADYLTALRELKFLSVYFKAQFQSVLAMDKIPMIIGANPSEVQNDTAIYLSKSPPIQYSLKTGQFASVAAMIRNLDENLITQWRIRLGYSSKCDDPIGKQLTDLLDKLVFVVEDVSPDSVYSVILLLARILEINIDYQALRWLTSAVDKWEAGLCDVLPEPSIVALLSSLVHPYFDTQADSQIKSIDLTKPWLKALELMALVIQSRQEQGADFYLYITDSVWFEANAAMENEKQQYESWLEHATQIQLRIPLKAGARRKVNVDALVYTEYELTGFAAKWARFDKANSAQGKGFGLTLAYRPDALPGNRFTCAADPRLGVTLEDFWLECEHLESTAWQAAGDSRAIGKREFPYSELATEHFKSEQYLDDPWYLNPGMDLVASPRLESAASRLNWEDVCRALWCVYHPLKDIKVGENKAINILETIPEAKVVDRNILFLKWPRHSQALNQKLSSSLRFNETTLRMLATLIDTKIEITSSWDCLTPIGEFGVAHLSGGFMIVSRHGVLFFDDWRETELEKESLIARATERIRINDEIVTLEEELDELKDGFIENKTNSMLESHLKKTSSLRLKASTAKTKLERMEDMLDLKETENLINQQWGLKNRLEVIDESANSMEASIKGKIEAENFGFIRRMNYVLPLIALIGLAGLLDGGVIWLATFLGNEYGINSLLEWTPSLTETASVAAIVLFVFILLALKRIIKKLCS